MKDRKLFVMSCGLITLYKEPLVNHTITCRHCYFSPRVAPWLFMQWSRTKSL